MNTVDFFSFKEAPQELTQKWLKATEEVFRQGQFIGGSTVQNFEKKWGNYLNIQHVIGVGNGYDALYIALKVLGIGPGNVVAVPSHTFIATWLAVGATGATAVGIDCDSSGLLSLENLEKHKTHFDAVIPVHMHGQMVDMPRLIKWAKKSNTRIVEDCAQAHGAHIDGKKAGTWGDIGAFSFYPTKNLGALGDAGALTTHNEDLAKKIRSIANYGSIPGDKYSYQYSGINSRLDPIQAAILDVNLTYLDEWNKNRIEISKKYKDNLGIHVSNYLQQKQDSIFHHFVILSGNRDLTRMLLLENGINTEIHYPESAARSYEKLTHAHLNIESINADKLSSHTLSLPLSPWMPDASVDKVIQAFKSPEIRNSLNFS